MDERDASAEDLFAEYVARYEAGEIVTLAEYCERHPELASPMRELERQWRLVAQIVRRASRGPSFADQVASRFGSSAVPGVQLERESDDTTEDGLRAVMASIRGRRGAHERYRRKDELGSGAMGIVYQVWDVELKRNAAMKVIRDAEEKVGWPGAEVEASRTVSRFIEEAQITSQLDHPGVVPVHEIGIDEAGRLFFTMRLVRGSRFDEILDLASEGKDGWNRARLLGVLLKACEAVAYAHDKGVIHRDLKPSNIMVGRFGEVYVMDWGLARPLDGSAHDDRLAATDGPSVSRIQSDRRTEDATHSPTITRDGDVLGTPAYMSLEQASGAIEQITKRSDVYSMGAVLYHLLSGRVPYSEPGRKLSGREVVVRILQGPPQPIEELAADAAPELLAICDKAMRRDATERYATMLEFADDLRAFLEHRVVRAYRTDVWAEVSAWVSRNRALVSTLALALVVIVAGTVYFLVRLSGEVHDKRTAYDTLAKNTREHDRQNHRLRARELIAQAADLYPATPAVAPQMREWLASTDGLIAAADVHEEGRAMLASATGVQAQVMRELFAAIGDLQTTRKAVESRLERANSLEKRSLTDHAGDWADAIERIAGSTVYRGKDGGRLEIKPQLGLAPLGPSSSSGFEEFWVVDSGDEPTDYDDRNNEWSIGPTTAIVLVLLPGDLQFTMGSTDRKQHSGGQVCKVALHPFFVGKHEVTQGQWFHVMGERPAFMSMDRPRNIEDDPERQLLEFDDRNPIESILWQDARDFTGRLDLRLPFEGQWEYAARGGTTTAYWMGDDPKLILERESITDVDYGQPPEDARDGFPYTSPVGALAQNPYGLFDVLGNVSEWCRDIYHYELGPARTSGDGERTDFVRDDAAADKFAERTLRGGSWARYPLSCMCADRRDLRISESNRAAGLRVVRPLWPCPLCSPGAAPHR